MFKLRRNKNLSGFSLVELSVVLTVIGITLGGALTLATKKTESEKVSDTDTRLDAIEDAIERFLILNQRLPCPADPTLRIDEANFGVEYQTPTSAGCGPQPGVLQIQNSYTQSGMVPVRTLNLTDEIAFDGWDRRFSYSVDYRLVNNRTTNNQCDGSLPFPAVNSFCFKYTTSGEIIIRSDVFPAGGEISTEAAYVLVSHGKNGLGAFRYHGSADRDAPTDDSEEENAEPTGSQHSSFDITFIQKTDDVIFDDVVRYRPKWQLIDESQGITEGGTCTAARDVLNGTPGHSCENLAGDDLAICTNIAILVHDLCLQ